MFLRTIFLIFVHIPSFLSAPTSKDDRAATILKYENTNDGSGNYHFSYETSNEIARNETGILINAGQPDAHVEVQGTFSYISPDGKLISVRYSADKNGYHILPTALLPVPVLGQRIAPEVVASLLGGG